MQGMSLISTVQPTAAAYLRNVAMDGACLWLPPPASNRATPEGVVPIRSATSACVRPARFLACNSSANQVNSASSALYSACTWGLRRAFTLSSSCVSILHLLHPLPSETELSRWDLLGFLDELMQHDDPLTRQRVIQHAPDPFLCFQAQFQQTIAEGTGMRHTQIGTVYRHEINITQIPCQYPCWHVQNIPRKPLIVVRYCPVHARDVNKSATKKQTTRKPSFCLGLGGLTLALTCCRKPQRRRSGGWRQSGERQR